MQLGIIKSFFLVSGVQIFRILCTLVQNKLIACFWGTAASGLWNLLQTFINSGTTFANMALPESGCREIARAQYAESRAQVLVTILILLLISAVGVAVVAMYFSFFLSNFIFDTPEYASAIKICCLSVAVAAVSHGLIAIINGYQLLHIYSKIHLCGYMLGLVCVSLGVVVFRSKTLFPWLLLSVELSVLIFCLIFFPYHNLKFAFRFNRLVFFMHSRCIVSMASGFFASTITASLMTMAGRAFLNRFFGLEVVGLYQAAWTVSGLYTGFLIASMGVDFIPRATKLINDHQKLNQLVNDQLKFCIMLSGIGVVGVISFPEIILRLLYSEKFIPAINIIRWQVLGVALRVIAYPFTYSIIALAKSKLYFAVQFIFWVGEFLLLVFFSYFVGYRGLGLNYCIAYAVYTVLVVGSGVRYFHFSPERDTVKFAVFELISVVIAWGNSFNFTGYMRYAVALIIMLIMVVYAYRFLTSAMSESLSQLLKRKLVKC